MWLARNIDDKENITQVVEMDWSLLFLATVWSIRKAGNDKCFKNIILSTTGIVRKSSLLAWDMQLRIESFHGIYLDLINGRWFRPPPGYVKLNVDDSARDGSATYGGLLRDEKGHWGWGFTGSCGCNSILYAELMAMKEGLIALHQKKCVRGYYGIRLI